MGLRMGYSVSTSYPWRKAKLRGYVRPTGDDRVVYVHAHSSLIPTGTHSHVEVPYMQPPKPPVPRTHVDPAAGLLVGHMGMGIMHTHPPPPRPKARQVHVSPP
jgi:hypothetical protein